MDVIDIVGAALVPGGIAVLVLLSLRDAWRRKVRRERMSPEERREFDRRRAKPRRRSTNDDTRVERGWGTQWDDEM